MGACHPETACVPNEFQRDNALSAPRMPEPPPAPQTRVKRTITRRLGQSEEQFMNLLTSLNQDFLEIAPEGDYQLPECLNDLPSLQTLSKLHDDLKSRLWIARDAHLGDIFEVWAPFLKIYLPICTHYETFLNSIDTWHNENPKLQYFLASRESFRPMLHKIRQRPFWYLEFLVKALARTDDELVRDSLERAVRVVNKTLLEMDVTLKVRLKSMRFCSIAAQLRGKRIPSHRYMRPWRLYSKEFHGSVKTDSKAKIKPALWILFTDIVLVVNNLEKTVVRAIRVKNVVVREYRDSADPDKWGLVLEEGDTGRTTYGLFEKQADRDGLRTKLRRHIKKVNRKGKRSHKKHLDRPTLRKGSSSTTRSNRSNSNVSNVSEASIATTGSAPYDTTRVLLTVQGLQHDLTRVSVDREDLYFKMVEKVSKYNEHTTRKLKKNKGKSKMPKKLAKLGMQGELMSPHQGPSLEQPPTNSRLSQEEKEACESPVPRRSSSESKRSFNKSEPSPVMKKESGKKERDRVQSQQDLPKHGKRASREKKISPRAIVVTPESGRQESDMEKQDSQPQIIDV